MPDSNENNAKEPVAEQMLHEEQSKVTPWSDILERMKEPASFWLATVRPDGRPHIVPVGPAWVDGTLYFTTGQNTVKGRNLAENPNCSLSFSSKDLDITFEGTAAQVKDVETLTRVAESYDKVNGWPAYVHDGVLDAPFSAPTTGPAPYDVYRVSLKTAHAFGTADETVFNATRYTW